MNNILEINLIDDTSKIDVDFIDNTSNIDVSLTDYNDKEVRDDIEELKQAKVDKVEGKSLTTNDFTDADKNKLNSLENYDDTEVKRLINTKQDKLVSGGNIKTINNESILGSGNIDIQSGGSSNHSELDNLDYEHSGHTGFQPAGDYIEDNDYVHTDNNYTNAEKQKLSNLENYDDTEIRESINGLDESKADKTEVPENTSDLINDSGFITKNVNDLTYYTLKTSTGSLIDLEINQTTYVVTLKLKDIDGNVISTDTIDLPLESVVVSGSFDSTNKKIVLTLQNGTTVDIPVGDLVAGLQTEITSTNKIASDLVDDSNSGNKFVTPSEKTTWNSKYGKPSSGIPKTDLASGVQTSLGKADTALQSISSSDVTSALGYTPYDSANPNGYTKNLNYYGTCVTAAATQAKVVVCEGFVLENGATISVLFTNAQTYNGVPTLNVNSTGAKNIRYKADTNAVRYIWSAGEIIDFTYNGTYWVMHRSALATTSYYGLAKYSDSLTSTSSALGATPKAINTAMINIISGTPVYSTSSTYDVGDRVRYSNNVWECITAITTAESWTAAHWETVAPLQEQMDDKQDTLVSGTNIKTINNQSILGSGNITIESGETVNTYYLVNILNMTSTSDATYEIANDLINNNQFVILDDPDGRYREMFYYVPIKTYADNGQTTQKFWYIDYQDKYNLVVITHSGTSVTVTRTTYHSIEEAYSLANGKQDALVSGTNIKTINNQSLLGSGNITIESGGGTVDTAMSDSSTNAVQNRVIKSYVDDIVGDIGTILDSINGEVIGG